jgi:hypothetical protein
MSLPRPCLDCGLIVRGKTRCWDCQRKRDRARGTRQQRGYTSTHDQLRALLVQGLDPWAPCPRCRHALGPDPAILDLMHNDDRTAWLGLGHRRCNRDTAVRSYNITPNQRVSPQDGRPRTPRPSNFGTNREQGQPAGPGPVVA